MILVKYAIHSQTKVIYATTKVSAPSIMLYTSMNATVITLPTNSAPVLNADTMSSHMSFAALPIFLNQSTILLKASPIASPAELNASLIPSHPALIISPISENHWPAFSTPAWNASTIAFQIAFTPSLNHSHLNHRSNSMPITMAIAAITGCAITAAPIALNAPSNTVPIPFMKVTNSLTPPAAILRATGSLCIALAEPPTAALNVFIVPLIVIAVLNTVIAPEVIPIAHFSSLNAAILPTIIGVRSRTMSVTVFPSGIISAKAGEISFIQSTKSCATGSTMSNTSFSPRNIPVTTSMEVVMTDSIVSMLLVMKSAKSPKASPAGPLISPKAFNSASPVVSAIPLILLNTFSITGHASLITCVTLSIAGLIFVSRSPMPLSRISPYFLTASFIVGNPLATRPSSIDSMIPSTPLVVAARMLSKVPCHVLPAFFASPAIPLKLAVPFVKASSITAMKSAAETAPAEMFSLTSSSDIPEASANICSTGIPASIAEFKSPRLTLPFAAI